jgi:tyrosyl-tRNA synthetase
LWKPVVANYHMLMGLTAPGKEVIDPIERKIAMKMSKSKPDSAIFMDDSEQDIKRKMDKAYCPEGIVEENPVLEYCKYIIFERFKEFKVERPAKFGGDLAFGNYAELEKAFAKKELHPMDLKQAAAKHVNELVEPVRRHFEKNAKAKKLLEQVRKFKATR